MGKGAIQLSLETLVVVAFALIIFVLIVMFIGDFFMRNIIFINGTV